MSRDYSGQIIGSGQRGTMRVRLHNLNVLCGSHYITVLNWLSCKLILKVIYHNGSIHMC